MDKIGAYEVIGELGRGGMGQVMLGRDPRLDRKVAMKRIRLDIGATRQGRQRFRSEARIMANLNHPAIVHVHDLIEGETEDVLVMEYVDGPNLRNFLKEGGHSIEHLLELAAQIAAGLAEAHRNGIVHRDLKTENVLIAPSGRAKITDFGIAVQLDAGHQLNPNQVAGTLRAMSPEQAMGQSLDYRSDLFSFGILLYEMFGGCSPFLADTSEETLRRIIEEDPEPIDNIKPNLPKALVAFINHLLSKNPALRPQHTREAAMELGRLARDSERQTMESDTWTGAVYASSNPKSPKRLAPWIIAGVMLVAACILFWRGFSGGDEPEPVFVAVTRATAAQSSEVPSDLLFASREAAIEAITGFKNVYPLDPEWVDEVKGRPGRVAQAVAADEALVMAFRREGGRYILVLRRVGAPDERILWSEALEVPVNEYRLTLSGVKAAMVRAYPGLDRSGEQDSIDADAFLAFLREKRSFTMRERPLDEHLEKVQALRSTMEQYAPVYLLESDVARFLYRATREDRYLAMSLHLAEQGRKLAPNDPRPLETLVNLALDTGDMERAESVLGTMERLFPGSIEATRYRARLLEQQGQADQALALLQRAVAARPAWRLQFTLANMAFRLGKTALAREVLGGLLEMEPDHPRYLRLLALLELFQGSPERALEHYLKLAQRAPGVAVWGNLATTQMLLGDYAEAVVSIGKALKLAPSNSDLHLTLADCKLLLGEERQAFASYTRVLELLDEDPAGSQLYSLLARAQAQAHLSLESEALATINQALEQAPGDMQVTYSAALVHAVLGDYDAALAYARQTYNLGNDPRWFMFPWFDNLREDAFFKQISASSQNQP